MRLCTEMPHSRTFTPSQQGSGATTGPTGILLSDLKLASPRSAPQSDSRSTQRWGRAGGFGGRGRRTPEPHPFFLLYSGSPAPLQGVSLKRGA